MSYLVLARKYRPHNFDEMVGQEHVVKALSNALAQQRLHHAYLFTGTRGVGKTTVSRILAKSLNCQGPDGQGTITPHPCGVCQACRDIDAGRFVDYTELDAASNRGVEEVQSLMEQAVYKPVQGRFKVFMIDEVHMLSNTAFNAMLKTLEEPPEYLKFVLATTDPQKVPVTVLSRCLQFNLRPMAPQTITEHLQHVLEKEAVAQDRASLQLLARAARGSMRDALSLTDQAIAYGNGALQESTVRQMLGVVDKRYVLEMIGALAAADGVAIVSLADTLRQQGIPAASLLEDMALALQKMALYQSVPSSAWDSGDDVDLQPLLELAGKLPPDETQLLYTFCLKGREELGLAPDEYSGLVMVLLRLLAFKAPPGSTPVAGGGGGGGGNANHGDSLSGSASSSSVACEQGAAASTAETIQPPLAETSPPNEQKVEPVERSHMVEVDTAALDSAAQTKPVTAALDAEHNVEPVLQEVQFAELVPSQHAPREALPWEEQESAVVAWPAQASQEKAVELAPELLVAVDAPVVIASPGDALAQTETAPAEDTLATTVRPVAAVAVSHGASAADPALQQWWQSLVRQLNEQGTLVSLVRELAQQSQAQKRDANGVHLRINNQSLMNENLRGKLQAILQAAEVPGTLTLEYGEVSASLMLQMEADKRRAQDIAQSIVENDVRVQWLQSHLGAEIVPGSIKPISIDVRH
ncbi:DNA polymerase III subunit gamma/tau [Lampropedia puyangensis]|uniref:DNA polymerase III subunit gamma/tau n=1 Tax=Lampropedia puyangensis TaxID=1330072 RepID=A0A4S8F601_9BURK|nr:DNA polymerase III subunit gamma/tau [Lampropedia puyangensis]THU02539.1 DNA polymerase III subunit gamma/tau [Lampropedia puyangensis]